MNTFAATALCATLFLAHAASFAQELWLEPSEIEIRRVDESATLRVTYNGAPIAARGITRVKLFVDAHDYGEMFLTTIGDGLLTLTPTSEMEMGRYDLVVDTSHGTVRGVVRVTLSDDPLLLENRARELGISAEELRQRLGLAQAGRESLTLEIAPNYLVGQALEVALNPPATREYMWVVNGQAAASGSGPHELRYVFRNPGAYTIRYQERDRGKLVIDLAMHTQVDDEPALPWEVTAHSRLFVPGPEGFDEYSWRVDGTVVSTLPTLRHTFEEPGTYTLECIASNPEPVAKYRKITYAVTAR